MEALILAPFLMFGTLSFYFGLLALLILPLATAYLFWEGSVLRRAQGRRYRPRVSVIVPAYNEERTIALSIASIIASDYPDFEVIVVNDGSSDGTERELEAFRNTGRIIYLVKPNGGKASALNLGLKRATGDIIFFTDADTMFERSTIRDGVRYLADPRVGAVGGNDTPLHPRGPLQKMLVVTSHIGTGLVRRALSMIGVLPIIPGNLGLVRADILRDIGGFREVWGEDLELTLRLHRHGVRVVYGARAKVLAECPHSLRGLWKQRVRWTRSYIKVVRLHRDMIGNPRFGAFGIFLALLSFNMIVLPIVQWLALFLLPFAVQAGIIDMSILGAIGYFGFVSLFVFAAYAIYLDWSPKDLLYLPYLLLLIPLSQFYNAVVLYSIWAEWASREERWNKLERREKRDLPKEDAATGHVSRRRALTGSLALAGITGAGLIPGIGEYVVRAAPPGVDPAKLKLAVALHFPDWPDWRDAVAKFVEAPQSRHIAHVAISAGRPDWTFFRWPGEEGSWSDAQRDSGVDMLAEAIAMLKARGYETSAVLDVLAPRYLKLHPEDAARDLDGRPSADFVCSTCLAEGAFGDLLVRACDALAAGSEAGAVCVTELFYDTFCFDERCLAAFRRATGQGDWPRLPSGRIDHMHRDVGHWRSRQVVAAVARMSRPVRAHGKRFIADVRVSRPDLTRNSSENGQDYRLLAPLLDRFVAWDYFALDGGSADGSRRVAAYLVRTLGARRYWHSIGLWGANDGTLDAGGMRRAIIAAAAGGARNIWITPGAKLSEAHWQAIAAIKEGRA